MSSTFSTSGSRVIPAWTVQTYQATVFAPFRPFGTIVTDSGYGSGGYGDFPYGQGVLSSVNYTTAWAAYTLK